MRSAVPALLLLVAFASTAAAQSPGAQVPAVEGAANPADAPVVAVGSLVDTIVGDETLWYALDAVGGQQVTATVTVRGQPDGPGSAGTDLRVSLTDQQRQPLAEDRVSFDGLMDATISLPTHAVPPLVGGRPLLAVSLSTGTDPTAIAGQGFRLAVSITVAGTPRSVPGTDTGSDNPAGLPATGGDAPLAEPPTPPAENPHLVGDLFPVAALALAVGGFAGFELSRRGL